MYTASQKHYGKGTLCKCMVTSMGLYNDTNILLDTVNLRDARAVDVRVNRIQDSIKDISENCGINLKPVIPSLWKLTEEVDNEKWIDANISAHGIIHDINQIFLKCE